MQGLIGKEVKHQHYGYGRIKQIKGAYLDVVFASGELKTFQYPWSLQHILLVQDSDSANLVRQILKVAYQNKNVLTPIKGTEATN